MQVTSSRPGQSLRLTIMRREKQVAEGAVNGAVVDVGAERADAQILFVTVAVRPRRYRCPRLDGWDSSPRYLIYGGCVFVPLTTPWCVAKKKGALLERYKGPLMDEGREVIVLSKVLAHAVNVGYHSLGCLVVGSCNGVTPFNLRELAVLLFGPAANRSGGGGEHDTIDLRMITGEDASSGERLICLDKQKCAEAEAEILSSHMIALNGSPDVMGDVLSSES